MGILSDGAGFQQPVLYGWPVGTLSNPLPQKAPFYKGERSLFIGSELSYLLP